MNHFKKHIRSVCRLAAAALVLCTALIVLPGDASAVTVPEGCVGIKVSFGKASPNVLSPGWHWTFPWENVIKMDCKWQKYTVTTGAFSKDIQQVDVQLSMSYSLATDGAYEMYKQVGVDYPDKIMYPIVIDSLKGVFAKYSAEELIANRDEISSVVFTEISESLKFHNLHVREVAIEDIDFTDAFTDAIEAKQVATQRKLQVQTEQEQQTLVAKAEAERAKIQAQADAEQKLIRAQAEADAKRIAADAEAYRLEKEAQNITDDVIRKAMIEKWDGSLPVISGSDATPIVDINSLMAPPADSAP